MEHKIHKFVSDTDKLIKDDFKFAGKIKHAAHESYEKGCHGEEKGKHSEKEDLY